MQLSLVRSTRNNLFAALSAVALLGSPASVALADQQQPTNQQADVYGFDTVHTQILFFADHIGFSKSQGEFLEFDGQFSFDADNWANSSVNVTIQTNSITMDNQKWDDHMKNADFFDVDQFPTMTFTSSKVESSDAKTGKVYGNLTLLGVTRPVVLDVTFNKAGVHPFSKKYVAGFSATTTVKRSEFGMKYGIPLLGNDIEVRLEVEGERK